MSHEFIEVLNRRWCICCDLFQSRKSIDGAWTPSSRSCQRIYEPEHIGNPAGNHDNAGS